MNKNNIIEYLSYHYDKYSDSDRAICNFFIANRDPNLLDIITVANKCNVSPSTVTRFAQKNGFSGFKEFSVHYQKCLADIITPIQLSAKSVMETMHFEFLEKLYKSFDLIDFNFISERFNQANNLFIHGFGKASLIAQMYEMKLSDYDKNIYSSNFLEHFFYSIEKQAKPNDLIIILYHHSVYKEDVENIIQFAKNRKVNIIVLSLDNLPDEMNYANTYQLFPDWKNNISKHTTTMYLPFLSFIDILSYSLSN